MSVLTTIVSVLTTIMFNTEVVTMCKCEVMIEMEYIGEQDGVLIVLMYLKCSQCERITTPHVQFLKKSVH